MASNLTGKRSQGAPPNKAGAPGAPHPGAPAWGTPGEDKADADGVLGPRSEEAARRRQTDAPGSNQRVQRLEEQLAQMQDTLSQLSVSAGGAWQRAGDAGRRAPYGAAAQTGAPEQMARRATAVAPKKLTYAAAQTTSTLEDWLYEVEMFCAQIGITDGATQIAEARFVMDRDLWHWWSDFRKEAIRTHRDGAQQAARAVDTWDVFANAMRDQFLAVNEQRLAIDAMCEVRQTGGESMEAYFLRAAQLYRRVHRVMDDRTVMRMVLSRARRDEWPYTYSKAITAVEAGEIVSLVQLRTLMTKEALTEPGQGGGAPGLGRAARRGSDAGSEWEDLDDQSGGGSGSEEEEQPANSCEEKAL
jgi:Retrotransposon gag protein